MADNKGKTEKKDKIIITVGGSIGYKIQGNSYESIQADTTFSIKKEVPFDFPREKLAEFFDRTNKILSEESTKKMKIAYDNYKENIVRLKNIGGK